MKISFAESMAEKIVKGEPIAAIADKTSLPTDVEEIVRVSEDLAMRKDASGIWHLCATGEPMSWHDYAMRIADALLRLGRIEKMPLIQKLKLADMVNFRDTRPQHTAMDNSALSARLARPIPTVDEMIAASVKRWLACRTVRSC